jgi:arginine-tRNA-protein transferase
MDPVTITTVPSRCEYLPDRLWRLRYEFHPGLDAVSYQARLQEGWRRFGPVIFRPECPDCRECRSLRVPVATFQPTRSQRRVWKRNIHDVTLTIGSPAITAAKAALFARFHQYQHDAKGWPLNSDHGLEVFTANPFPTEEWRYSVGDRLIGLGYVDALPAGLSAIYFVWDPEERQRSLGTFNILEIIDAARKRGLPHVYPGYYVAGCRSLEYKGRFGPHEMLSGAGEWTAPAGESVGLRTP